MRKVIVTGAGGFIGGSLVRELLHKGMIVYGVDIDISKFNEFNKYQNFIPVVADFSIYGKLPQLIENREIDVFYHFAWAGGFTSAIRDYSLQMQNAAYAGNALVAAKEIGCNKFVYAGTYNEYEIRNFLATESFEPRYTCIYSTGKTAADLICRTLAYNLGINYNVAFIPMPYGENNYSKQLMNVVIDSLNKGVAPKLVEGKNTYDIVYIKDIVDAFIAIGDKGVNSRGYYVGHRKLKTFRQWMTEVRDVINPDIELKFGEYKDVQNIDYSMIDLEALYRDTGFECKSDFKESILKTAKWVKENF